MNKIRMNSLFERYINLSAAIITILNLFFALPSLFNEEIFIANIGKYNFTFRFIIVLVLEAYPSYFFSTIIHNSFEKNGKNPQYHLVLIFCVIASASLSMFNMREIILGGKILFFWSCVGLLVVGVLSFVLQVVFINSISTADNNVHQKPYNERFNPFETSFYLAVSFAIMYIVNIFDYLISIAPLLKNIGIGVIIIAIIIGLISLFR